ncbi:MAG TPA: cell surface protein SprA [candidate division Zixibacteria bacterium]|nr:cell surface protein SprA [candidate division Zixibacteria bacterium]
MSLRVKIVVLLLVLSCAGAVWGVEISDLRVPLDIKSRFVLRTEEGPPSNRKGLYYVSSSYLLKYTTKKYKRDISFSSDGDYIYLRDYYGDYQLPNIQIEKLSNYVAFRHQYALNNSWKSDLSLALGKGTSGGSSGPVTIEVPWEPPKMVQSIIGEGKSSIQVSGSRSISFSGRSEWEDGLKNTGTFKQSKFPTLQMEQTSRFKVTGSIGSKITVEVDQDSKRDVDLANTIKLRYKGGEDEILQTIEAGNTNLSLPNSQLIGYSQNVQGLFGIKATAKIGNLDLTMITSQEKGTTEKANFNAGAKGTPHNIRDYEYLAYTYFWLDVPHTSLDSLLSVELYVSNNSITNPFGIAVVNPHDSLWNITPAESTLIEYVRTRFAPIASADYEVVKPGWYVVLNKPIQANDNLGAYIKYFHHDSANYQKLDTVIIGNLNYRPNDDANMDTTLVLQMLMHGNATSGFETWNRMWRNVYNLGSRDISADGFELKIYKGTGSTNAQITDPEDQNGHCYITLLGLDSLNNTTRAPGADCSFDFNNTKIDAARGHLIFPNPFPFTSDSLLPEDRVYSIYNQRRDAPRISDSTKFYIYVKSSQRASSFSLGRANIMPNSEVVRLGDGTTLRRDVDYRIDYEIGQITFLNDQALNPAANVSVDFEYAPFFMPEKKSLFGMAGQYQLGENSNISMAAMYRSETASDPRPRVGREPKKGLVWDSNFDFNFKPEFMTNLVDALPFVETDAPSSFQLSGEVAQSFPNPNTKNQAFIDDFEGARSYTDLSTRRGIWTVSSPPLDLADTKLDIYKRSALWWYNPITTMRLTDIWPDRDVKHEDDRIDVLFLNYFPDTTSAAPESSWAGIIRPFFAGLADQTDMKFIEVWYYSDAVDLTEDPTINFDFGAISEDINDNGSLDSEDRQNTGARGVFEPDQEDTGLDGVFDGQEPGYNASTNQDPNHDDWIWNPDDNSINPDYSHINGTEGNNNDPDRRGRYDTEDINNNTSLDRQNGYFEYTVHLKSPQFLADSTTRGWKLLRIPFQDSSVYKLHGIKESADFQRINYARIWFSGAKRPHQVAIATIQLVGNKWQELPIAFSTGDTLRPEEKFEITIKNTQENSSYYPPPGVAGNLDRSTGIREKEQSLVLAYQNLDAGDTAKAFWNLYTSEDYTQYSRLKLYVHGDTSIAARIADGKATFFLRLSQDQDARNFYEYHTVLEPGWSENNWVDIDFTKLTALKYELLKQPRPDSAPSNWMADTTEGNYRVHGNPALSQVKTFIVGVEINGDATELYSGEVWIDEMRVIGVRRKTDFAGRLQAVAKFSDLLTLTGSYNRTGADFTPLAGRAAGSTSTSKALRIDLNPQKLFPPSVGMSLPVSVSWQKSLALPRLKPGSDIILNKAAQQDERTESKAFNLSVSQSFNRNTKNWFWNLTLNRLRSSYTFNRTIGISPSNPIDRRDTYRGTGAYDLTPRNKPTIKPFFLGKYIFLPSKIYNTQLFYLPTQLSFSGEVNGSKTATVNYRGIETSTRVRDLTLSGNTGFDIFSTLHTAYSLTSARDISQPGRFKLSINPSKLKLGQEKSFTQRLETSFQPKIVKPLENRFSFSSNYAENSDFVRNPDSTRATQMGGTFKTDLTLNLQTLFGSLGRRNSSPPPPKRPDIPGGDKNGIDAPGGKTKSEQGGDEKPDDETKINSGPGIGSPAWFWEGLTGLFRSIDPIRASYTNDRKLNLQGLMARPSWKYMFGLINDPRVPTKIRANSTGTNQSVYANDYQLDTGMQPGHGLVITSGYSLRKSITRSSNEPALSKTIQFPDVQVRLGGLEKMALFKKFSNGVTLQTSYVRKVDENGQADTGELYKRDISKQWAPLASLGINFINNIRVTLRYDLSNTISKNLRSEGQVKRDTYGSDNTIAFSLTYSLTAPKGLKLPLLKRIKFNSQLSISLDISLKNSKTESVSTTSRSVDTNRSQTVIEPRLTYQFSRAITGGVHARWDDSNDKIQKHKRHVRELGINAEIRF